MTLEPLLQPIVQELALARGFEERQYLSMQVFHRRPYTRFLALGERFNLWGSAGHTSSGGVLCAPGRFRTVEIE